MPPHQRSEMKPGMKNQNVCKLQEKLKKLGLRGKDKNGYFGSDTRDAVREIQRKHGLDPSGVVNKRTAKVIDHLLDQEKTAKLETAVIIKGQVLYASGRPMQNAVVRVFEKMGKKERLKESSTDNDGFYSMTIPADVLGADLHINIEINNTVKRKLDI